MEILNSKGSMDFIQGTRHHDTFWTNLFNSFIYLYALFKKGLHLITKFVDLE